ncbi:hypothetical protein ACH4TC_18550 [Streptomyces spororaveus]|uniref:hypothetical protein n=1 Tax=Streptomyces spororaveus TaxID=284039 RepID=UPI0037A488B1
MAVSLRRPDRDAIRAAASLYGSAIVFGDLPLALAVISHTNQVHRRIGTSHFLAHLAQDIREAAPAHLRCKDGHPDLAALVPTDPDALRTLHSASEANRLFGRGPVTAADLAATEQQILATEQVRPAVQMALAAASHQEAASAIHPATSDPRTLSAAVALLSNALTAARPN